MKQKLIIGIFAICLGIIGLFTPQSAAAYTGVSGAVYDGYNVPWQHGFTIYMIGTFEGTNNTLLNPGGTIIPVGQHVFDAPFVNIPDDGTDVTVVIVFPNGGNGVPSTQQYTRIFTQFSFISGSFSLGNISTQTGPTAVSLQNFGLQSGATLLPLIVLGLALMTGATIFVVRRRQE